MGYRFGFHSSGSDLSDGQLVRLLARDDAAYTTPRIRRVARIAWNEVHMHMCDCLPGNFSNVDSDIVSGGMAFLIE